MAASSVNNLKEMKELKALIIAVVLALGLVAETAWASCTQICTCTYYDANGNCQQTQCKTLCI